MWKKLHQSISLLMNTEPVLKRSSHKKRVCKLENAVFCIRKALRPNSVHNRVDLLSLFQF